MIGRKLRSLSVSTSIFSVALCCPRAFAAATGPFGTGLPDSGYASLASFPWLVRILIAAQTYFDTRLTEAVRALHQSPSALWTLVGLSFLYGVVHAVGPGHGKALVSTYLVATRQTWKNGVKLSVLAALSQALGAIVIIGIATLVLKATSVTITRATFVMEVFSDLLIVLLGAWLVWDKILKPLQRSRSPSLFDQGIGRLSGQSTPLMATASRFQAVAVEAPMVGIPLNTARSMSVEEFCDCGGLHLVSEHVAGSSTAINWSKVWPILASTAFRPCTGALIILVFAIRQHLAWAGILATLAMGVGTAITIATIAGLTLMTRETAQRLTGGDSVLGRRIKRGIQTAGALGVLIFGLLLLLATLASI